MDVDYKLQGIPEPQKLCGLCRKPADKCGCCPTDDGPADDPSNEVKTHYERRGFDREGV